MNLNLSLVGGTCPKPPVLRSLDLAACRKHDIEELSLS